ncbi:DsbA family protein [Candidatus Woesearchaeota archaeon]|nr:DsbA family protein [Candidatus Woesearchaeota archaeon]
MRRLLLLFFVVSVIAVSSCAVPEPAVEQPGESAETAPPEVPELPETPAEDEAEESMEEVAEEGSELPEFEFQYPYIGAEGAFAIIEYGDFSNQVNTQVNNFQVAAMKRDFVVSNKAKIVFKPYPLSGSEEAQLAAEASLCMWEQGSKQFWAYHDTLFTYFLYLDEKSLNNYVGRIPNADKSAFAECLSSRKYRDTVSATLEDGKALGIDQTPTFIIGSESIVGSVKVPYKTFKETIETKLAQNNPITGSLVSEIFSTTSDELRSFLNWFV